MYHNRQWYVVLRKSREIVLSHSKMSYCPVGGMSKEFLDYAMNNDDILNFHMKNGIFIVELKTGNNVDLFRSKYPFNISEWYIKIYHDDENIKWNKLVNSKISFIGHFFYFIDCHYFKFWSIFLWNWYTISKFQSCLCLLRSPTSFPIHWYPCVYDTVYPTHYRCLYFCPRIPLNEQITRNIDELIPIRLLRN